MYKSEEKNATCIMRNDFSKAMQNEIKGNHFALMFIDED